jgi:kojibiose phosphorylase
LLGPFQSTQAIKQADVVLLLYLLRDRYSPEVQRANWLYYEPRTAHDSSLSPLAYALVAANVGMVDWAYRYFLRTAMLDLLGTGPHWNLGVHTAAMGGAWLSVVHGFCQLDLREDGLHLLAWPRLPAGWRAVRLTLWWHGHCVSVEVTPRAVGFAVESGSVPIIHPGGRATVTAERALTLDYAPEPVVSFSATD